MANLHAIPDSGRRSWGPQAMLLAGGLLVALATGRSLWAWRQSVADRELQPVLVSEVKPAGFLPILSPARKLAPDARLPGRHGEFAGDGTENSAQTAAAAIGDIPVRILIPAIGLDAPIVSAGISLVRLQSEMFYQWDAPDFFAAGWDGNSARLGAGGNTVLIGHHNIDGEVFRDLHLLQPGAVVAVFGQGGDHSYRVTKVLILKEKYQDLATRLANAIYIEPTKDERLTLVTCWPYVSNTHRLIVIAEPFDNSPGGSPPP